MRFGARGFSAAAVLELYLRVNRGFGGLLRNAHPDINLAIGHARHTCELRYVFTSW